MMNMRVQKRNGSFEEVSFDKVIKRIKVLANDTQINVVQIAQKVCARIYDGVHTSELDELAAQICSSMILDHPDYGKIAGRIIISNHQKNTSPSFSETVQILYDNNGNSPLVSEDLYNVVMTNKEKLNSCIDYSRDFNFDYFGFKTLEKSYLLKIGDKVIERPQHMFMRVAIGIHNDDIKDVIETYELMSKQYCIHATPTLFNSGTPRQQMSSCFLGGIHEDSIVDIYDTLKEVAQISKYAGGVGIHIHGVRGKNSVIHGTNGVSTGIVPMLRVFNNTARYVNQCFAPETQIITIMGTKQICEIEKGDYVLTSNGIYQPVLEVFKNEVNNRSILEFNSKLLANPIRVTNEHKLFVFNNVTKKTSYIYADEFSPVIHDMCYPIEFSSFHFNKTPEYYRIYGMFIANGYICHDNYVLETLTNDDFIFVAQYLQSYNVPFTIYRKESKKIFIWKYAEHLQIEYDMIYDSSGKKRIYVNYLHADKMGTIELIRGLTNFGNFITQDVNMIQDIVFMWLRVSHNFLHINKNETIYEVNFKEFTQGYVREDKLWFKIESVRKINYTGSTYDLCVNENHNYTTAMGLVHNSGRRNGSIAVYLEPWHTDIESFLELRKNNGNEEERARDLFYAMWISDLFMNRVKEGGKWSLMCPNTCKGLPDVYGEEFEKLYCDYESRGMYTKQIDAQDLWFKILESQIETGTPYMMYKDHVNKKSNQKNIGTIKSSNLCVTPDTLIYTDKGYHHIGYLASLCKFEKNYQVNVWNGEEFSRVNVLQTGSNETIMYVTTNDGLNLGCTYQHKFYLADGTVKNACELQIGDKLETCNFPIVETSAWGNIQRRLSIVSSYLNNSSTHVINRGYYYDLIIPFDAESECLRILYILQTLGIRSWIKSKLILVIRNNQFIELINNFKMFLEYETILVLDEYQDDSIIVSSLLFPKEKSDTFCFHEPKRNRGVFNGILAGNCTEIVEYTSHDEWAVCNLASMCLPSYIDTNENGDKNFNFQKLHNVTKTLVKNLNKVIDRNFYPIEKAKYSNLKHRPIGLGVQGLADTFVILRYPFESEEAYKLNRKIFETIYHAALESSNELAIKLGKTYESFEGSPASQGILQFDMWEVEPSDMYNWKDLKDKIKQNGLLNSLLVAPMPTASTSQICGFNESFEAFTSNIYKRKTLAGEFIVVNKYLIQDLQKLGLWNTDMKNKIILSEGSIQKIPEIPQDIKDLYKMVWEIKQKAIIDMAADRGAFVDQSQSMNLFMENPDYKKLSSMHFYAWQKGLKTGMYYLRSKAKAKAQQFTMDPKLSKYTNIKDEMQQQPCDTCSA